jgi:hypothetical protein
MRTFPPGGPTPAKKPHRETCKTKLDRREIPPKIDLRRPRGGHGSPKNWRVRSPVRNYATIGYLRALPLWRVHWTAAESPLRSNDRTSEPGRFHSKNPGVRVSLRSRHRSISCASSQSRTSTDRSARLWKRFAKASMPYSYEQWRHPSMAVL